ncbi:AMP-binding protein [Microlunatus sp. Y2014]|uniref:AMP-binding protein n=1 Tax=Microlunatus sp. Y2014 TaxID=3418488 RepID=UPI003DA70D55
MAEPASANRLVAAGTTTTWADLEPLELPPAAAVFVSDHHQALRVVRTHLAGDRETLLAQRSRLTPELQEQLTRASLAVVVLGSDGTPEVVAPAVGRRGAQPGRLWLLTSGTTGRPKQVGHTLDSLTTVRTDQPAQTWLCPYTPGAYAWWQVVTLGLSRPGQDIVFVEPGELETWPDLALEHGVTAASGTPTFWRQALLRSGDVVGRLGLSQVTLGGEPVDQPILDQLRAAFPEARVSWIYASSEAGAAITVHDGRAGFPVAWLDRTSPDRPVLQVDDGELVLSSPNRGDGVDERLRTGDRVEVVDGRVLIVGRIASDEINVGGSKASAAEVRDVLLQHPWVRWAAVRGRKAPMVGTIVVADVVLDPAHADADRAEVDATLTEHSRARLAEYAVPRRFKVLPEIPTKESLKSDV